MARRARLRLRLAAIVVLSGAAGCSKEKIKRALEAGPTGDPGWTADSSLLASKPNVMFRAIETKNGTEVIPIGVLGPQGFRELQLGNRGWRAFDLDYLHAGHELTQFRDGQSLGTITTKRGMWGDGGAPLDSIPGCQILLPGAVAVVADRVKLLTTGTRAPLKPSVAMSDGEVQEALSRIPTLVAPIKGIPLAKLPQYTRTVHQVNNGSGGRPTLVVTYDDPQQVPDSVLFDLTRPRHLLVILDHGIYGYKTTYIYSTLGNSKTPPRFRYLDYLDLDDDGRPEILFGIDIAKFPLYTIVLHRQGDEWKEMVRYNHSRCLG